MKLAPQYEYDGSQQEILHKARKLEILSLAYLLSVVILMYLVMGSSQAMKTAWIEDCLSMIPPICFLVGAQICWKKPTRRYPYGFHRAVMLLFLVSSLALLTMGSYLLVDAITKLAQQEHPTIGMKRFLGVDMWLGWWMIAVLIWGTVPPVFLGRAKLRPAEKLNDKILVTDGKMNKADWMTAVAAIGGVLGIGMGWWWADASAAAFISFGIVSDGWKQTKDALTGLINRSPTNIHGGDSDLPAKAEEALRSLPWVSQARVRLYEHGHLIFGEAFIGTVHGAEISHEALQEASEKARATDWRLKDLVVTLGKPDED